MMIGYKNNHFPFWGLLLSCVLLLASCTDVSDEGGKAQEGKGVAFTLTASDWNMKIVGPDSLRGAKAPASPEEAEAVVDLSPEVSANVSIVRDDREEGVRRAPAQTSLGAGDFTIVAYQGRANNPEKKAELKVHWDGSKFTEGGNIAKMHLPAGTYTFVCFNDKLKEKDGKLVMANYDKTANLTTDQDYQTYYDNLADDYDKALVGKVTTAVPNNRIEVPFVLSHPWSRVKFQIVGVGLAFNKKDTDYSTTGTPTPISYDADVSAATVMTPSAESVTTGMAQTKSVYELNAMTLAPVDYSQSDVDVNTGTEKINNKRVFHFGEFENVPHAQELAPWHYYYNSYQRAQTSLQYFPAGANLKAYKWNAAAVSFYRKPLSFEKLYQTIEDILPTSLEANGSYTVRIYMSYNFKYLFSDGTVGTLAENNNWKTKTPIALVTSMKTKTAVGLITNGRVNNIKDRTGIEHINRDYYATNSPKLPTLLNGYRTTYDPAYTYDQTKAHAEDQNLPAFYTAAHYNPGVAVTAEWLKNPSTDVNDSIGKWYLPAYGEMVNMYRTVGYGTYYNISDKRKETFQFNTKYEWRPVFIDIAFRQAGSSCPPSWHRYWTSTELERPAPNFDFCAEMSYFTDGKFWMMLDYYNDGVALPFIHFK